MEKLIVFGAGDIAELSYYYFSKENKYEICAFTVDKPYLNTESFHNIPVVDFEFVEKQYAPDEYKMFVAISYSQVNKIRAEKYYQAKNKGYKLISYISEKATIFDNVELGENCFILEDNTIQPFVKIGNNVTLWSGNHIGHHSIIGDHCFVTSQVVISGGVKIEPFCFIGVNSTIRDHITIAKECVIGAGSIIMKDTIDKEVYIPSRTEPSKLKSNQLRGL
jgi:sugar O-acyltransferase (sialic acid O-acetyltransferase NeuD family)